MDRCIDRIVQTSNNTVTNSSAKRMLESLDKQAKEAHSDGIDYEEALFNKAKEMQDQAELNMLIEKRNLLINIKKVKSIDNTLATFREQGLSARKAWQTLLVGSQANVVNGRFSIDTRYKQLLSKYFGGLVADFELEELLPAFRSKTIDRQIAQELWELTTENGKVGISGSLEAQKIAKIFLKYQKIAKDRLNRNGASIGSIQGYVTRQSHDMVRIKRAGYQQWKNSIIDLLDVPKTIGDADIDEFLGATYEALSTGIHLKSNEEGSKLFAFKGPRNLGKKLSEERVLHFKDADSWYEYNQKFGTNDVVESIIRSLDNSARSTALMETFGTNPRAMFERQLDKTIKSVRHDPKEISKLQNNAKAIRNFFDEVEGATNIPGNPTAALIGSVIRSIQSMSKLGGAVISSISDIPFMASELRNQGRGFLDSYAESFSAALSGRGNREKRQLSSLIGVGMDGMLGSVASRFSATDDLPGTLSKLQRQFFKLNLQTWWTDTAKVGIGMAMSRRMAQLQNFSFNQLDDDMQRVLGQFGILDREWDVIRRASNKLYDNEEFVTADAIQDLDDTIIADYLGVKEPTDRQIQDAKDLLESRLQAYFVDRVDFAVLTPDARERAILKQGYRAGTLEGEAIRYMMQFKA
ncbi:MAG: hypothetical protein MK137_08025, partial [Rickettsiales bacterium]|nr:hypothetical protein [Rickettsiales bacterium]